MFSSAFRLILFVVLFPLASLATLVPIQVTPNFSEIVRISADGFRLNALLRDGSTAVIKLKGTRNTWEPRRIHETQNYFVLTSLHWETKCDLVIVPKATPNDPICSDQLEYADLTMGANVVENNRKLYLATENGLTTQNGLIAYDVTADSMVSILPWEVGGPYLAKTNQNICVRIEGRLICSSDQRNWQDYGPASSIYKSSSISLHGLPELLWNEIGETFDLETLTWSTGQFVPSSEYLGAPTASKSLVFYEKSLNKFVCMKSGKPVLSSSTLSSPWTKGWRFTIDDTVFIEGDAVFHSVTASTCAAKSLDFKARTGFLAIETTVKLKDGLKVIGLTSTGTRETKYFDWSFNPVSTLPNVLLEQNDYPLLYL